jgi:hypothetical protein
MHVVVAKPLLLDWAVPGAEALGLNLFLADRTLMWIANNRTLGQPSASSFFRRQPDLG